MIEKISGMAIIFHSGDYDRLQHGLHIAQAASALGREVRLFFTYAALLYLKKDDFSFPDQGRKPFLANKIFKEKSNQNQQKELKELLRQTKELGAKFYVCSNSMSLRNIARDELNEVVDRSMGLTTFLATVAADQILFI